MARLPSKNDLSGPASLRSGRMISSADMSGLARGVASLGNSLSAIGAEQSREQNAVDLARAEAMKTEGLLTTQNEFDQDGDYSTFKQRAPQKTKAVVDQAAALIRDPSMRERWAAGAQGDAARINDTIFDKASGLRKQAETNSLDEALETYRRIYVDPATSEDDKKKARADIEGAIGVAGEIGLLTPDQQQARKDMYVNGADVNRAMLEAQTNPGAFIEQADGPIKSVVNRIIGNESSGDPNAQNSRSSAGGLGGFIDSTWVATAKKFRPDVTSGMSNDQIIELKKSDPKLAYELATRHTEENAKGLALAGLPVTDGNVYLAHFAGLAGAKNILNAPDGTAVANVLSADAIRANPEVLGGGKTVGDVKAWADRKMGTGGGEAPRFNGNANQFLKTRLQKQHGPESIDVMSPVMQDRLASLMSNAPAFVQEGLDIMSGARTRERQTELWNQSDKTGKRVARPGHSKHEDRGKGGEAADLGWKGKEFSTAPKEVRDWVHANLATHGLALPMSYEPWHIEVAEARGGAGPKSIPGYMANLSPEDRFKVQKAAEAEQSRRSVEMRSGIEVIVANAPTAILNTGEYSGQMPGPEQFFAAYGPQDGAERYNQFQSSVQTAEQAHGMKTMSADEISAMVNEAAPTSSGNDAAMESKRYETLSAAAKATLEAREKDPAVYANSAFPSVAKAWQSARNPDGSLNPQGLQAGIAASVAAQTQMGVSNIAPLPKAFAEGAVKTFKNDTLPGQDRIAAVSDVLMATPDPLQRKAIFNQMVKEGLPDVTEGAFAALERGDKAASDRLFQAAIVDVAKLPGKAPFTVADIDLQIQTDLLDEGKVGDVYYGLRDGTIENLERAQRDARLLNNAVNIRVRGGETLQSATAMAAKDLFGEVKAVTGDGRVNAQIILPQDEDESLILDGLAGLMPEVEKALTANVLPDAPAEAGAKAIISAATQNHNRNILSEGFFRSVDEGFVFIDPYDGTAIEGPDGNPVVFTRDQVLSAKPALPELLPTDQSRTMGDNVQTEMQMQEERVRKMYEGAQ